MEREPGRLESASCPWAVTSAMPSSGWEPLVSLRMWGHHAYLAGADTMTFLLLFSSWVGVSVSLPF